MIAEFGRKREVALRNLFASLRFIWLIAHPRSIHLGPQLVEPAAGRNRRRVFLLISAFTRRRILGTYEHGKLTYRARVGTGFTEAMRRDILAQLETRLVEKPAFASVPRDIARRTRWVSPDLVAEVTYSEVTSDGSLRHPSFQGMREDKRGDQVVMEMPKTPAAAATAQLDPGLGKDIASALGVKLTHPDKIMYPDTGVTKATLAAYYTAVVDKIRSIFSRPRREHSSLTPGTDILTSSNP